MEVKCKICGGGFEVKKADKYQVTVPNEGLIRSDPTTWDAMDCPHCGSQNLLSRRYDTIKKKTRWI